MAGNGIFYILINNPTKTSRDTIQLYNNKIPKAGKHQSNCFCCIIIIPYVMSVISFATIKNIFICYFRLLPGKELDVI